MDPANEMRYSGYFQRVTDITVVDSYTLEVQTEGYDVEFMERMINIGVISPSAVRELGDDFTENPVGSGPFKFVSRTPGERVVLERNDDYWRPDEPCLDGVVLRVIPEESVRMIELEAEGVHLTIDMAAADLDRAEQSGMQILETPYTQQMNLYFNLRESTAPGTNDVAVRKAVNHAIDKEGLINTVFKGLPVVSCYTLPELSWVYDAVAEVAPCYEYDVERAKAILDEAGWEVGDDGIRVNEAGDQLEWYFPASSVGSRAEASEIIAGMLAEIGIQADVEIMDHAAFIDIMLGGGHDICYMEWLTSGEDPWSYTNDLRGGYAWSPTGYDNPEVNDLILAGKTTLDRDQRIEIYEEYFTHVQENALVAPIGHKPYIFVARPEVQDLRIVGNRVMFHSAWLEQ
jgi:peptide/nickel transport system substrate-binding protein